MIKKENSEMRYYQKEIVSMLKDIDSKTLTFIYYLLKFRLEGESK